MSFTAAAGIAHLEDQRVVVLVVEIHDDRVLGLLSPAGPCEPEREQQRDRIEDPRDRRQDVGICKAAIAEPGLDHRDRERGKNDQRPGQTDREKPQPAADRRGAMRIEKTERGIAGPARGLRRSGVGNDEADERTEIDVEKQHGGDDGASAKTCHGRLPPRFYAGRRGISTRLMKL